MEIKFRRDTAFRKQFFVPDSFAHPAKMDAQLLIWCVERYSKVGETILDPMAGSGTTMLACMLGRDVVLVELEEKFIKMCRDNWEQVKMRPQLGYQMGTCQIIQGDARSLKGLCDKIISSPPYGNRLSDAEVDDGDPQRMSYRQALGKDGGLVDKIVTSPPYVSGGHHNGVFRAWGGKLDTKSGCGQIATPEGGYGDNPKNIGNLPYGEIDKCIFSPPYAVQEGGKTSFKRMGQSSRTLRHYAENPNNIDELPYGQIDKIVTSPPYSGGIDNRDRSIEPHYDENREKKFAGGSRSSIMKPYSDSPDNLGNLSYGNIDSIITSPPYEGSISGESHTEEARAKEFEKLRAMGYKINPNSADNKVRGAVYSGSKDNIGNLKSQSYLEAMLLVYRNCFAVLRPQGLMILVVKNFIRQKKVVRLDLDTIGLCQRAGFSFLERHYRKLPSQSFWRIIYSQKHPEVEQILYEDILVLRKANV